MYPEKIIFFKTLKGEYADKVYMYSLITDVPD